MQRRIAIVGVVWVPEALGAVPDDTFEEGEVLEVDGAADTDGDVDPSRLSLLRIILSGLRTLGMAGLT